MSNFQLTVFIENSSSFMPLDNYGFSKNWLDNDTLGYHDSLIFQLSKRFTDTKKLDINLAFLTGIYLGMPISCNG